MKRVEPGRLDLLDRQLLFPEGSSSKKEGSCEWIPGASRSH